MLIEAAALLAAAAAGFGLGRVKNAGKLAAISAEIAKLEADASADAAAAAVKLAGLVAKIKSLL